MTHLYSGHEWLSEHYLNFLTSAVFVYESERGVTTRNKQLEVFKISDILQIFEIPIEEELIIIIIWLTRSGGKTGQVQSNNKKHDMSPRAAS